MGKERAVSQMTVSPTAKRAPEHSIRDPDGDDGGEQQHLAPRHQRDVQRCLIYLDTISLIGTTMATMAANKVPPHARERGHCG